MDDWKRGFLEKLHKVQSKCAQQFEDALDRSAVPVFDELSEFLADNGFKFSTPLNESGRRSFKLELAENAYLLLMFRFAGVDEFELRTETFAPSSEPILERCVGRTSDVDREWAESLFQVGLDRLVDLLSGEAVEEPCQAVAAE